MSSDFGLCKYLHRPHIQIGNSNEKLEMAALRLGMIGAGKFAARHLEVLDKTDPDAVVVGHLSGHVENAEAAARRFGGAAYGDLGTFLGEARPDAVILTVPPDAHGAYEEALIAARIPFLVEKPVGLDFAMIEHLANAIDKAGLTVAVGFNWRASDHMPALRAALAMHAPRMVMGHWHGGIPASPWWRIKARSGGQFVEQAIHIVDLAITLLGDAKLVGALDNHAPLPNYPDGDIAGAAAALVQFRNDVPGVFTTTCLLPEMGGADLTIICDNARIVVTQRGFTLETPKGTTTTASEPLNAYLRQDKAFFAAIRGNGSNIYCSYTEALPAHRICLGLSRSTIAP
jgi:predicted dehydrogenase